MEKQRVDSLKVVEFILAEDIATMEENDSKINRVEQLRTSCRRLHNELKITIQDRYDEKNMRKVMKRSCKQ